MLHLPVFASCNTYSLITMVTFLFVAKQQGLEIRAASGTRNNNHHNNDLYTVSKKTEDEDVRRIPIPHCEYYLGTLVY